MSMRSLAIVKTAFLYYIITKPKVSTLNGATRYTYLVVNRTVKYVYKIHYVILDCMRTFEFLSPTRCAEFLKETLANTTKPVLFHL